MIDLSQCHGLRLGIGGPGLGTVRVGCRGLVCAGVEESLGQPALIGLVEEADTNLPSDALVTLEAVITQLGRHWARQVPIRRANLVMNASTAGWAHVWLDWRGNRLIHAEATPVQWPGVAPCSEDALVGVFGQQARRLLAVIDELVVFDRAYFEPPPKDEAPQD